MSHKKYILLFIFVIAVGSAMSLRPEKKTDLQAKSIDNAARPIETSRSVQLESTGWWGKVTASGVAVRSGPSDRSKRLGSFSTINKVKVLDQISMDGKTWYKIDGGDFPGAYVSSDYISPISQPTPEQNPNIPSGIGAGDYWIDVNITKQVLTLFKYDKPVFATYVSTGRKKGSTVTGSYAVWEKLAKTRMHGGPPAADHVYDLTNVPYVMYYHGSFAVHGTYWHDKFGTPQSAGCTNITQGDAKYIFDRVNVGTVVYNHY